MSNNERIIFHIDVNSAFLSWEAVYRLKNGSNTDLRTIPSVIGGDESSRKGVVLARSTPAKQYGIKTGESLYSARKKCPQLVVVPPCHELYAACSQEMHKFLEQYSPVIEKFSIDECFMDFTGMTALFGDYLEAAFLIKDSIKDKLGFTVNIGVSHNRLLAKMAGEFSKPDKVHTLWPHEISQKLWPLPVEELYMVGRSASKQLHFMGIKSIGDLAGSEPDRISKQFKSYGRMIWNYANGIEKPGISGESQAPRGIGNSLTTPEDVKDLETAYRYLLSLSETVASRLRERKSLCNLVSVGVKNSGFRYYSHQRKLEESTNSTHEIYEIAKSLFIEMWKGEPLRLLAVRVAGLSQSSSLQMTLFTTPQQEKQKSLDEVIDNIRSKKGSRAIVRAALLPKNNNTDN